MGLPVQPLVKCSKGEPHKTTPLLEMTTVFPVLGNLFFSIFLSPTLCNNSSVIFHGSHVHEGLGGSFLVFLLENGILNGLLPLLGGGERRHADKSNPRCIKIWLFWGGVGDMEKMALFKSGKIQENY